MNMFGKKPLRVIIVALFAVCMIIFFKPKNISSTDLMSLQVGTYKIGMSINDNLLIDFKEKEFIDGEYQYNFEYVQFNVDDNFEIVEIKADTFRPEGMTIKLKNDDFESKHDIKRILGNNCIEDWYDREQKLKSYTYVDNVNHLRATFIYEESGAQIVWVILAKFP